MVKLWVWFREGGTKKILCKCIISAAYEESTWEEWAVWKGEGISGQKFPMGVKEPLDMGLLRWREGWVLESGVFEVRRVWIIDNGKLTVMIKVVAEEEYTKKMIEV